MTKCKTYITSSAVSASRYDREYETGENHHEGTEDLLPCSYCVQHHDNWYRYSACGRNDITISPPFGSPRHDSRGAPQYCRPAGPARLPPNPLTVLIPRMRMQLTIIAGDSARKQSGRLICAELIIRGTDYQGRKMP